MVLVKLALILLFPVGRASPFDLTVLHTNDVHARFEQTAATAGRPCAADDGASSGACFGGVARRAAKVREIRGAVQNVLLLDAGDGFQGTVWFYVFRGQATAHFMNMLQYDAMALGNHEFDLGIDESLVPFLRNVTFPVLSCNVNSTGEPSMTGLYACQATVTLASGDRVGIVGYTLVDTPLYTKSGNLVFSPEIDTLQPAVDSLVESGVDAIIALGHSGIDTDIEIAKKVRGVDVVIGGHSNTFMYTGSPPSSEIPYSDYPLAVSPEHDPDATVLVASAYAYGKYLGRLDLTFDDEGVVSEFAGNPILLDNSVPQDTETRDAVLRWKETVELTANRVVGSSLVPLRGNEFCYSTECNMGNVLADAMLAPHINQTAAGAWSDVAVAMTTSGSVKANEVKKGDVTVNDLLLNMPYGNTIDVLELRGAHILDVLEHSVRRYEAGGNAGEFLQVSGLRVSYDVSRPVGSRVLTAHVLCADCAIPAYEPLDNEELYRVAMNSYMAAGGYGFPVSEKLRHVKGDLDVDVTSAYLRAYSPIRTGVEGRVTVYNGDAPCYQDQASGAGMRSVGPMVSLPSLLSFVFLALT